LARFPKKREWAALLLLADRSPLNLGDAVDILKADMCVTKRTALRIIKRLKRLGLAKIESRGDGVIVSVLKPSEALAILVGRYLEGRRARCGGGAKNTKLTTPTRSRG
jgi:hypothetical protein